MIDISKMLLKYKLDELPFFVSRAQNEVEYKADLYSCIERSKSDPSFSVLASNAMTILNAAGEAFSYKDFSGIRIPGAHLPRAIFDHANLSGADMRGVNLENASLKFANLSNTNLSGLPLTGIYAPPGQISVGSQPQPTSDEKEEGCRLL